MPPKDSIVTDMEVQLGASISGMRIRSTSSNLSTFENRPARLYNVRRLSCLCDGIDISRSGRDCVRDGLGGDRTREWATLHWEARHKTYRRVEIWTGAANEASRMLNLKFTHRLRWAKSPRCGYWVCDPIAMRLPIDVMCGSGWRRNGERVSVSPWVSFQTVCLFVPIKRQPPRRFRRENEMIWWYDDV